MTIPLIPIHVANLNLDTDIRRMFQGWYITSTSDQKQLEMNTQLSFPPEASLHDRAYLHIHYELNKHGYCCGVQLFLAHPKLAETLCFRIGYKLNIVYEMSQHPYMDYLREVQHKSFNDDPMNCLKQYIKDHPSNYVETNLGYIAMLETRRVSTK